MGDINYERSASEKKIKYTICDVHRDIYHRIKGLEDLPEGDRQFLLDKIEVAFAKGKHMSAKLSQYAYGKDQAWFEKEKKSWNWTELREE